MKFTTRGWGLLSTALLVGSLATLLAADWLITMTATLLIAPLCCLLSVLLLQRRVKYTLHVEDRVAAPGPVMASLGATPKHGWARSRTITPLLDEHPQGSYSLETLRTPSFINIEMDVVPRGRHTLGPTRETFYDPFGLVRRERMCVEQVGFLVWPETVEVPTENIAATVEVAATTARRGMEEFSNIRPYTAGDDPRRIHWRSSARRTTLQVRETADSTRPEILLLLSGVMAADEFETAVSVIASLYTAFCAAGADVSVVVVETDGVQTLSAALTQPEVFDELAVLSAEKLALDNEMLASMLDVHRPCILVCDAGTLSIAAGAASCTFAIDSTSDLLRTGPGVALLRSLSDLPAAAHDLLGAELTSTRSSRRSGKL